MNNNYEVKIRGFGPKVYTDTTIKDIVSEVSIFTDVWNIESITRVEGSTKYLTVLDYSFGFVYQYEVFDCGDVDDAVLELMVIENGHRLTDCNWMLGEDNKILSNYEK